MNFKVLLCNQTMMEIGEGVNNGEQVYCFWGYYNKGIIQNISEVMGTKWKWFIPTRIEERDQSELIKPTKGILISQ